MPLLSRRPRSASSPSVGAARALRGMSRLDAFALAAAGVAWSATLAMSLMAYNTFAAAREIDGRAESAAAIAATAGPSIRMTPPPADEVKHVAGRVGKMYPGVRIVADGPQVRLSANALSQYQEFVDAVGQIDASGARWRWSVTALCVGLTCVDGAMSATMRADMVSVAPAGQ